MGYEEKKAELGLAYGILDCPTWAGALFYGVQVCFRIRIQKYQKISVKAVHKNVRNNCQCLRNF